MFWRLTGLLVALSVPTFGAEVVPDSEVYSLLRDSIVPGVTKVHVATFDTDNGRDYNRENCMLARDLFQSQPGVQTNFWCEPGRFSAN